MQDIWGCLFLHNSNQTRKLRTQMIILQGFGSSSQRRIDGIYATTLSADIAQTALLKKRGQRYIGPDGYFNNSLCPSEFQLISETNSYGEVTFTHLTIAEINGGIDGLLLGMIAEDWNKRSELSLSQVSTHVKTK